MSLPPHLVELHREIKGYATEYGLDYFDIIFELVSVDEMNMVAAYGGFPTRYPHWRFGMEYESLSKSHEYGLSKIYELVINTDPCYAYLIESNSVMEQKLVMAHVYGHCDFFRNNYYFRNTNRRMLDQMANHAARVRRYMDRYGIDRVESFMDCCLSIENLIDQRALFERRQRVERPLSADDEGDIQTVRLIPTDRGYMRNYINPKEFIEAEKKKLEEEAKRKKRFPEHPQRDVPLFIMENAPLELWEQDCLDIVREEGYYFAPQGQTKIMNEGWACIAPDSLVFTEQGLLPMREVVNGEAKLVSDGDQARAVYDAHVIGNHATVTIKTRRGFELTGSNNHRVRTADGAFKRLDELRQGDRVEVASGAGLWPTEQQPITWRPSQRTSLTDVAEAAEVSVWTVLRHRKGLNTRSTPAIQAALELYEAPENQALPQAIKKRKAIKVPQGVDEDLGAFLGYLIGDGHISKKKRQLGLTTADEPQAARFAHLSAALFGVPASLKREEGKLRVLVHAESLSELLTEHLKLTHGPSARDKAVPQVILRSPKAVVASFLSAYFDCDAHAGPQGVCLSTASDQLAEQVQLLLLNFGILSRRKKQKDGCWHLWITGASAQRFAEEIGFGLSRKQVALLSYVQERRWFKAERWDDEVETIEHGRGDVYDISVEQTHRYAACGLMNHNSFWHSKIMTTKALKDSELMDYADSHSATMGVQPGRINPYKLGLELFKSIEERWNKGQFGKEWEECDDFATKKRWDKQTGQGRSKIFEVRKLYNDITFIDEFLTEDFAREQKLFVYGLNRNSGNWEIQSREFRKIKHKLLAQLTNFGQPIIDVIDGNWENRGELLLKHTHDGVDLQPDWARDTLENLQKLWRRPVAIATKVENKGAILRFDGTTHSEKATNEFVDD